MDTMSPNHFVRSSSQRIHWGRDGIANFFELELMNTVNFVQSARAVRTASYGLTGPMIVMPSTLQYLEVTNKTSFEIF